MIHRLIDRFVDWTINRDNRKTCGRKRIESRTLGTRLPTFCYRYQ